MQFIINNKNKYRFLFIPHDSRKNEYEYLELLYKLCPNYSGYITTYLEPEYEKYITSKLYFIITGRMHLAILTIPNIIPTIIISYNGVKARGTLEHCNIEELVIEPKNIHNLDKLVNYVVINYKIIQTKINNKLTYIYNLVNKQIIY
mgnify:CR=1 FL=1